MHGELRRDVRRMDPLKHGLSDDPVLDALLYRGFLARMEGTGVVVPFESAAEGDLRRLQKTIQQFGGQVSARGEISWPSAPADVTGACRAITGIPTVHRWAPYGWSGYAGFCCGWQAFMNTRFGARVPVQQLEPEIALLVKALGLIGVMTLSSCSGHDAGPGQLRFRSGYDLSWATLALEEVAGRNDLGLEEHGTDWRGSVLLVPDPVGPNSRRAALALMTHAPGIREAKQRLTCEEDLDAPVARALLRGIPVS